ncbi:MAG: hypothetical protein Q7T18_12215 [Sedimentisphaerales bacterium]|nr:hypothetical protein [Sedimentisphaerales bacterium]
MEPEKQTIPTITIAGWPTMAIPELELRNILTYLAYKTGKPVTFAQYAEDEGYSKESVSVRVAVHDNDRELDERTPVHLGDKRYQLSEPQVIVKLDVDVSEDKNILDTDFMTIAYVDHNRIVIPIELTATDNEAARGILASIAEKAVELLDFNVDDKLLERRDELAQSFCHAFAAGVRQRATERQTDLRNSQRAADQAYHTIVEHERKKPVFEKEIEFLKRLSQNPDPMLFKKQAKALVDLQASGDFTAINANDDGTIVAATAPITIEHDGYEFEMGRYSITIDNSSEVNIKALDPHPKAQYPHPHIAQDGYPCLGSISGDIPKLLGSMHIAEAFALLYEFLRSYSPEGGPYEKISAFDTTGRFVDHDSNSCEDCDESCTPFCIGGCGNNEGIYGCSDCCEYRSSYCYRNCDYRQYCGLSPCDDCEDERTAHCYLECQDNSRWQKHNPCENDCEYETCNQECPYYAKWQSLKENNHVTAR